MNGKIIQATEKIQKLCSKLWSKRFIRKVEMPKGIKVFY